MGIESLYQLFIKSNNVTIDSRTSVKGSLFFGLKGDNTDGNKFAGDAINNGCSYAIIDNPEYKTSNNVILVENVLKTLQELATYHRKRFNIPIIAITGSNGKTTTKELIASVLNKKYSVCYTQGNYNNHIGVPLSLLKITGKTEIAVIEMGANHLNEIMELCQIAIPDYGLITNIGKAHMEGFGSYENIIKAKSELYDYLNLRKGKVFYNKQNDILSNIIDKLKVESIPYGESNSLVKGNTLPTNKFLKLNIYIGNFNSVINTKIVGDYNLENILAAAAIGSYFKVDPEAIIRAIEFYTPKNNRSQLVATNKNNIILDAYNANPTSVNAALENFNSLKLENKCLILGDMLELGDKAKEEHQSIMEKAIAFNFQKIILVGELFSSLEVSPDYLQFAEIEEVIQWLRNNKITNSNILIKGSRGIQLEKVANYL